MRLADVDSPQQLIVQDIFYHDVCMKSYMSLNMRVERASCV